MLKILRIESVRGRLTLFYVSVLAAALIVVGALIYALLARSLYVRVDENLHAGVRIAMTSLANDLAEGQDYQDAARSTAAEQASSEQMIAIYDQEGRLLAESGREGDLEITLPPLATIPANEDLLQTVLETDRDDRHRLAFRSVAIPPSRYIVVTGADLEPMDEELESLRGILGYVVPLALCIAAIGGSFLARQSLSPVVSMADRARKIGVENLSERLPVANSRDELEYRETLAIVEQQAARLSRVVDDMFTLARADAGNYPVRMTPMYLDEVIDEVVRAGRVIASTRNVSIDPMTVPSATFTGDEDLIRRMIGNLIDNAVRHAPPGTTVRVDLDETQGGYAIAVRDQGAGIPVEIREQIFERFYRGDASRRSDAHDGAGLGLALSRWIANAHGGDVVLARSSPSGSTFVISLPSNG